MTTKRLESVLDLAPLLRCPSCSGDALARGDGQLLCHGCNASFQLDDGVLVMLTPEQAARAGEAFARELEDWDRNADFYLREARSPLFRLLTWGKWRTYRLDREKPPMRILDLGAGTGYFSRLLLDCGHEVITMDFSPNMLRLGQQAYRLPLLIQAAVPPLPFRDGALDAVVANGLLHHCKAQGTMLETVREIVRVLRPGGLFLLYDRNGALLGRHLHHFVMRVKGALERRRRFVSSSATCEPDFNDADLRVILDSGLTVERRRDVSSLATFVSIVVTNTVEYLGWPRLAAGLRFLAWPFAAIGESLLPLKALTVEQCVRFRKPDA